jgi:16S rRNA (uracil1498-N3)-methyltransferase
MVRYDFRTPRLFVDAPLAPAARIALDPDQTNYLVNVLRRRPGASVLVFNGHDGEWQAGLTAEAKKRFALAVVAQTRPQPPPGDLHYLFAPLKAARLDYMVQKAVEMGASRLQPVFMQHSQAERVNLRRMRANAIEAAEQCGILTLPDLGEPVALATALAAWEPSRLLVFCDEDAEVKDPLAALAAAAPQAAGHAAPRSSRVPLAVLIGPEGGFTEEERAVVMALPRVVRLSLGPRTLRADTAAVAALTLVGAVLGDWR